MSNLLNLDNVSAEKKRKILEILGDNNLNSELKGINNSKQQSTQYQQTKNLDDYKQIYIDSNINFDSEFENLKSKNNANSLYQRRISGRLTLDEAETYRQLGIIHEDGFWDRVKEVVSSKKGISRSDISDKLSQSDLGY